MKAVRSQQQKHTETDSSGSSCRQAKSVKATLANASILQGSANKLLFVLDGGGRLAALNSPLLRLLAGSERTFIGRLAGEVFTGAAGIISSSTSGPVRFCSSTGNRWQALLTVEIVPVTTAYAVVIGTLTQVSAVLATEPKEERCRSSSPAAEAANFGNAIKMQMKEKGAPYRLTAGRIQLIGLEEVKAALGPNWPAQAARAKACAKAMIARRLADADTLADVDDDTFIICFASLSAEEARVKSELIAREIRERLVGEETAGFTIHSQVEDVLLEEQDLQEDVDLITTLTQQLDVARAEHQRAVAFKVGDLLQNARLSLETVLTRALAPAGLVLARIAGDCGPWLAQIGNTKDGLKLRFELDCLLLGLATAHVYQALTTTQPPLIIVPVNFSTLHERKFSRDYFTLCGRIDDTARGRILFKVVSVSEDVPQVRLQEILSYLAPFSARRILGAPNLNYKITDLNRLQVAMVAVSASRTHIANPNGSKMFKSFTSMVHDGGTLSDTTRNGSCRVLVRDIPDANAARWYSSNGADFLCMASRR